MTVQGIQTEKPINYIKSLQRSADKSDAVVMALYKGVTGGYQRKLWGPQRPRRRAR
jgi:hypothetical protein